jgi:hypothetical protein
VPFATLKTFLIAFGPFAEFFEEERKRMQNHLHGSLCQKSHRKPRGGAQAFWTSLRSFTPGVHAPQNLRTNARGLPIRGRRHALEQAAARII